MKKIAIALLLLCACGDDDDPAADSLIAPDYAETYSEVRDCRRSGDHDLMYVRVLASPESVDVYQAREGEFPVGTILVKEEHATPECDDLTSLTAMRKEAPGTHPDASDWTFERASTRFRVDLREGEPTRCVTCHSSCDDAFDLTCTLP